MVLHLVISEGYWVRIKETTVSPDIKVNFLPTVHHIFSFVLVGTNFQKSTYFIFGGDHFCYFCEVNV